MCNITTCNIKNDVDKQTMMLCVEWNVTHVKILILRHGELPVRGQMEIEELVKVADNFNRSKDQYLADIKGELSGSNPDIQFLLKDKVFIWKKKIWTKGKIICEYLTETIELSNSLINFIDKNSVTQKQITDTEADNRKLRKKIGKLESIMEKMTKKKNSIEEELCKRFLILLNSKKNRIRALRSQLHKYTTDSIYDKSTDESDMDSTDIESESTKRVKIDINENTFDGSAEKPAGLSLFPHISHVIDNTHESDDSFELKLEETQSCETKTLNITDEDPEEDIFSS